MLSPQPFAPREKIYREEGMRPYNAPAEEDAESALLKHGSWIWRKCETPAGSRSFFRRSFDGEKVRKAELYVTADDFYRFRLNGRPAGSDEPGRYLRGGWNSIEHYDLTPLMHAGKNLLEFEAWDGGAVPCGFHAVLKLTMHDGSEHTDGSSAAWESAADAAGRMPPPLKLRRSAEPRGDAASSCRKETARIGNKRSLEAFSEEACEAGRASPRNLLEDGPTGSKQRYFLRSFKTTG